MALAFASVSVAQDRVPPDVIRALYLRLLISDVVTWPDGKTLKNSSHISVCIYGDKKDVDTRVYKDSKNKSKLKIIYTANKTAEFINQKCDVVYIAANAAEHVPFILKQVMRKPVLTISSSKKFVGRGGMFGLVPYGDSIRFSVNKAAITDAGLRANPDSLALAVEDPD